MEKLGFLMECGGAKSQYHVPPETVTAEKRLLGYGINGYGIIGYGIMGELWEKYRKTWGP